MKLTQFEIDVLAKIFRDQAPEYINDIARLRVRSREHKGDGLNVVIKPLRKNRGGETQTFGEKFYVEVEGIENGASAMLHFEDGVLTLIEIYSNGPEDFPEVISNYKIV